MRKSRFAESQIVAILKEDESGIAVAEVCRKHGISQPTYYQRKSKYAGVSVSELKRMRELEIENDKLKRLFAEQALEIAALKDVLGKKLYRVYSKYRDTLFTEKVNPYSTRGEYEIYPTAEGKQKLVQTTLNDLKLIDRSMVTGYV